MFLNKLFVITTLFTCWFIKTQIVSSFTLPCCYYSIRGQLLPLLSAQNSNDDDTAGSDSSSDDKDRRWQEKLQQRAEKIQVEKARDKLEKANTASFLKRRPRKLPYADARKWVQANLGCETADEFNDLVENGNLRTPYIPKRPKEYYTRTGDWISWEHFLTGCFDQRQPSAIKPQTGVFD